MRSRGTGRILLTGSIAGFIPGTYQALQSAIANVTPAAILAEQHRRMAEPGSAKKATD
jgi:short-subunit dehydrogenase